MDYNSIAYKKAKNEADLVYKRPSAYKSMFIKKKYEEYCKCSVKEGNLRRWIDEKWIQVIPYLTNGKIIPCGSGQDKKSCRPLKRINKKTPMTIDELIKLHGKDKLLSIAEKKKSNMNKRMNWKTGVFY